MRRLISTKSLASRRTDLCLVCNSQIWCLETLKLLLVIEPRLPGNIFSLLYSETTSTLYIGCQSTSVQWIYLPESVLSSTPSSPVAVNAISLASSSIAQPSPSRQFSPKSSTKPTSRFFDSCSPSPVPSIRGDGPEEKAVRVLAIREECTMTAHWGYVYCLAWIQDGGGQGKNWLVSGSGAGDVKVTMRFPSCLFLIPVLSIQTGFVLTFSPVSPTSDLGDCSPLPAPSRHRL